MNSIKPFTDSYAYIFGSVLILLLLFPAYLYLVFSHRYRRMKEMHCEFNFPSRHSYSKMSVDDAFSIHDYLVHLEFPKVFSSATMFAIFKVIFHSILSEQNLLRHALTKTYLRRMEYLLSPTYSSRRVRYRRLTPKPVPNGGLKQARSSSKPFSTPPPQTAHIGRSRGSTICTTSTAAGGGFEIPTCCTRSACSRWNRPDGSPAMNGAS
jgi:hypothetical protein